MQVSGIKKPKKRPAPKRPVRAFRLGEGVPALPVLMSEVQDMWDVLLGRRDPPVQFGVSTLMEVADAYFCRASEISARLLSLEHEGRVVRGSGHYKFRTGELRLFMEAARRAADLGSRRITISQLQAEEARLGRGRRLD